MWDLCVNRLSGVPHQRRPPKQAKKKSLHVNEMTRCAAKRWSPCKPSSGAKRGSLDRYGTKEKTAYGSCQGVDRAAILRVLLFILT